MHTLQHATLAAIRLGSLTAMSAALAAAQSLPVVTQFDSVVAPTPPGPSGLRFGQALLLDGDLMVASRSTSLLGRVFLFQRGIHGWIQTQALDIPTWVGSATYGSALAMSPGRIAVGVPGADTQGNNAGAVVLYEDFDGDGTFELEAVLEPPPGDDQRFGTSIDFCGERIIVGGPQIVPSGPGAAWIYARNGGTWALDSTLDPGVLQSGGRYGWRVQLQGEAALVAAPYHDVSPSNKGAVFAFQLDGGVWRLHQILDASQIGPGQHFGWAIHVQGSELAIGEPVAETGRVHLYEHVLGSWSHVGFLTPTRLPGANQFGRSIDRDGMLLGVGAPLNKGALYLFQRLGPTWLEVAALQHPDLGPWDMLGTSIAVDWNAGHFAGGAPRFDDHGLVFVYSIIDAVTTHCPGDGSAGSCPCENSGSPGHGCRNSTAGGALLSSAGSHSAAFDDLHLAASDLLPGRPALLFAGDQIAGGGSGVGFGDGLMCAAGRVVRLGVRVPDASGHASWGPGLASQGGWRAGDARIFQVWYRDPTGSPCGQNFNLTQGLRVEFVP